MNTEHRTLNTEHRTRGAGRFMLGALSVVIVGLVLGSVAQTNTPKSSATENTWPTFQTFNIIERNNIFDPNRYPVRTGPPRTNRQPTQAFALTGTMSYPKGWFAVFNGTGYDYQKVLGVGGVIAGYTVTDITLTNVTLAANGKSFRMPVGKQVRNSNGKWQIGQPTESTNDETSSDETTADSSAVPTGANAQMSEILKRLMEAKAQELKESK